MMYLVEVAHFCVAFASERYSSRISFYLLSYISSSAPKIRLA